MKELVELIVRKLVNHPEEVEVTETVDEQGAVSIIVKINPDDMGKVIGKNGRTATAIRTVARTCAKKANKRVDVKFDRA